MRAVQPYNMGAVQQYNMGTVQQYNMRAVQQYNMRAVQQYNMRAVQQYHMTAGGHTTKHLELTSMDTDYAILQAHFLQLRDQTPNTCMLIGTRAHTSIQ
jgi:hypothetical protein